MSKTRLRIRIVINLFTAIAPFAAWMIMIFGKGGILSSAGIISLKYFTVLSNLLEGIASILWLLAIWQKRDLHKAEVMRYISCLCVLLTFITVVAFLGPIFGYGGMFSGGNFWLHLIIPLVALGEMLFLVREKITMQENAMAIIPIIAYGIGYLINIVINGRGNEVDGWNDFYGFFAWGMPVGFAIFAGICLIIFGVGFVLRKIIEPGRIY